MLQAVYQSLVSEVPGKTLGCITTKKASELLRKSLNECTKLLRARGNFNAIGYKKWAEKYYQFSVLLLEEHGLTPFKQKILLMPKLVVSNFILSPWEHLCEPLEKSNHQANKDFQSRTMRGGGRLHNQDPLLFETLVFFSSTSSSNLASAQLFSKQCGRRLGRNQSNIVVFTNMSKKIENFQKLSSVKSVHLVCCFLVCDFMCWILSDVQRQQLRERKQNRI